MQRAHRHHRILAELPQFEAIELRFGPDFEGVDLHVHDDFVDAFFVLEGEAEFTIDGEVSAGPGLLRRRAPGCQARLLERRRDGAPAAHHPRAARRLRRAPAPRVGAHDGLPASRRTASGARKHMFVEKKCG